MAQFKEDYLKLLIEFTNTTNRRSGFNSKKKELIGELFVLRLLEVRTDDFSPEQDDWVYCTERGTKLLDDVLSYATNWMAAQ